MDTIPPPTTAVVVAAVASGRRLIARIDRDLEDLGLTWGRFHALVVIDRTNGWIHAGALARKMAITRQSAQMLLRRLDERGFLHDTIAMYYWGIPVATMRIGPIDLDRGPQGGAS